MFLKLKQILWSGAFWALVMVATVGALLADFLQMIERFGYYEYNLLLGLFAVCVIMIAAKAFRH